MPSAVRHAGQSDRLPGFVRAEDIREMLKVSKTTMGRMRSEGRWPKGIQIGPGSERFDLETVLAWVQAGCPVVE